MGWFEDETKHTDQYRGKLDTLTDEFYKTNTNNFFLEEPDLNFQRPNWLIKCLLGEVRLLPLEQEDLHTLNTLIGHASKARLDIFMFLGSFDALAATDFGRNHWQENSSHESELGKVHALKLQNAIDKIPSLIQDITMPQELKNANHLLKLLQALLDIYLKISKDNKKKIFEGDPDTSTRTQDDKKQQSGKAQQQSGQA